MNGKRYLLDTNAIIALLQGSATLVTLLQNADWVGISIISQIEFLAFSGLTEDDRQLFEQFLKRVEIINLLASNNLLIKQIIQTRLQYRVKLPDAIIASTALQAGANLVTADQEFTKVVSLIVINW
ncbi:type II toxin-antitoxin system VapC family toxin [Nostocaceae cyanobacterium CENA357]|uniref:Type II toxin-antitoxin system VapC family toxin n=1 Tax=Atlanticothrix silvestris CENA357 TaxID=1725252 RepID=A0A8J7HGC5_9CYAN|nr:type II toxin-antitoxin system VapC family toxin [Atlanticothrix silvestris]MBH8551808.1 type II toxin-antitoxin system VapC family toxin [Atlanticothrix silvestris CENA357]